MRNLVEEIMESHDLPNTLRMLQRAVFLSEVVESSASGPHGSLFFSQIRFRVDATPVARDRRPREAAFVAAATQPDDDPSHLHGVPTQRYR